MNQDSRSRAGARTAPVTERGRRARANLLLAAENVFGEHGYEDASIAEICRVAKAALGSFYAYFADKKAAYIELVDSLGHRIRAELATATRGQKDRLAVERAGLLAFLRFLSQHQKLYRIIRQAEFVDEPAFRRYYDRLAEGYAAGLRGAIARNEIRAVDPEITSFCLMGMSDFLGLRWRLWEDFDVKTAERVVDAALDFVSHGLALPPASAPSTPPRRRARTKAAS